MKAEDLKPGAYRFKLLDGVDRKLTFPGSIVGLIHWSPGPPAGTPQVSRHKMITLMGWPIAQRLSDWLPRIQVAELLAESYAWMPAPTPHAFAPSRGDETAADMMRLEYMHRERRFALLEDRVVHLENGARFTAEALGTHIEAMVAYKNQVVALEDRFDQAEKRLYEVARGNTRGDR